MSARHNSTFGLAWGGLLLLSSALTACGPVRVARSAPSVDRLLEEARAEGIALEHPLQLDADIEREVRDAVANVGDDRDRIQQLVHFLYDSGHLDFQYASNASHSARGTYYARRGDCMAFANLFTALARTLGLPAYFVRVRDLPIAYADNDTFYLSSHIAVGIGTGPAARVVDFSHDVTGWRLGFYERIDELTAASLFFNNLAVEHLTAGRSKEAERLLRFLLAHAPESAELVSNLGAVLLREGRTSEALALLTAGIDRFPTTQSLYTNALVAARRLHRSALATELQEEGRLVAEQDPYFRFSRGVLSFERHDYARAAAELEAARRLQPDNVVFEAWLARAYASGASVGEGRAALRRARRLSPTHPLVVSLTHDFPELAD